MRMEQSRRNWLSRKASSTIAQLTNRYESTIFLLLYVAYCVMMCYNVQLERWANTLPLPLPDYARRIPGVTNVAENATLMPYKNLDPEDGKINYGSDDRTSPGK